MFREIHIESSAYPFLLKKIKDAPLELYSVSSTNLDSHFFNNCISIVGSRKMTPYGFEVVNKIIKELSEYDVTVVSGFMYGVDIAVHKACLNYHVRTCAVLPYGIRKTFINKYLPSPLVTEIINAGGSLISEYPDNFSARKWTFIQRNRLVAGISYATLIIEAAEDSGSLTTGRFALKFGRALYVVPGNMFYPNFQGLYHLYKEGATFIKNGSELAELHGFKKKTIFLEKHSLHMPNLTSDEKEIIDLLAIKQLTLDALVSKTKFDTSRVLQNLTSLMLKKYVNMSEGGLYYVL